MKNVKTLDWIALILLLVGGVNLGLVGLFNFSLVHAIFGNLLTRLIYIAVGAAAGFKIYLLYLDFNKPKEGKETPEPPKVKPEPPKETPEAPKEEPKETPEAPKEEPKETPEAPKEEPKE